MNKGRFWWDLFEAVYIASWGVLTGYMGSSSSLFNPKQMEGVLLVGGMGCAAIKAADVVITKYFHSGPPPTPQKPVDSPANQAQPPH